MVTFSAENYKNFGKCVFLDNGEARVGVTVEVGPRIINYAVKGGENIFFEDTERSMKQESEELTQEAGELGVWYLYGGHRFWTSPEDFWYSYDPDNLPVEYSFFPEEGAVLFTAPLRKATGLRKSIRLTLAQEGSGVTVEHRLTNLGTGTPKLALWGVNSIAAGAKEIVPLPTGPAPVIMPRQNLSLWSRQSFTDPRLGFADDAFLLTQDCAAPKKIKIGTTVEDGWVASYVKGSFFAIAVPYAFGTVYPDRGCNYETFTNQMFLEMETLGELAELRPGETRTHTERWGLALCPEVPELESEEGRREAAALAKKLLGL